VGTAESESIYEAKVSAAIKATAPTSAPAECEVHLPLPPQIISLADLDVKVYGVPSTTVAMAGGRLIWRGVVCSDPALDLSISYSAVGKRVYRLETPPSRILDQFKIKLAANGSDVRMLELSLQPTSLSRQSDKTEYTWDYKRLMFGRPIAVDVLGIAPVDRLGELGWLGPISVLVFGVLMALVAQAYRPDTLDKWVLLLTVGTFAGAYPLMYFAQEFFSSLNVAIAGAALVVLLVIGIRAVTLLGAPLGMLGVVLPAAIIMAITLWATVQPALQGILLTAEAIGSFVLAMMLVPRLRSMGADASA
jgi:hypothetical protein